MPIVVCALGSPSKGMGKETVQTDHSTVTVS